MVLNFCLCITLLTITFLVYFLPLQLPRVLGTVAGKLWTKDLAAAFAEEYAREEPWLDFAILPLALQWQL